MRLLIVTDAWHPQVNGVVRTLDGLASALPALGVDVAFLTPALFRSVPLPSYGEIRLALTTPRAVAAAIESKSPDAIHIATEGPLGLMANLYCRAQGRPFTTCYHTRFPEYLRSRLPIDPSWTYSYLRWFHRAAAATLVATPELAGDLETRGFGRLKLWRRGVADIFSADTPPASLDLPRPIFLTVGRLAVEKNLPEFLSLDLPGSKVVVGDGPARARLQARYPAAHFLGVQDGAALAALYRAADVFVFPSRTDTFGLVMLEALTAGTPVAAFPVEAPLALLAGTGCGECRDDLAAAARAALHLSRAECRAYGSRFTMEASARSFLSIVDDALALGGRLRAGRSTRAALAA